MSAIWRSRPSSVMPAASSNPGSVSRRLGGVPTSSLRRMNISAATTPAIAPSAEPIRVVRIFQSGVRPPSSKYPISFLRFLAGQSADFTDQSDQRDRERQYERRRKADALRPALPIVFQRNLVGADEQAGCR